MAIELIKEAFKVEELKGSNEIQALVETEVYISPTKPNIEKILWVQGKVDILNTKLIKDKLIVNGVTRFNILYKSTEEENNIHTMETLKEFREEMDIPGIDEDMISRVKSKIEYIQWDQEESRIGLQAFVNLSGEVSEFSTKETIKEIKAKDSLQMLKESVNYKEVKGREISYAVVKEILKIGEDDPEIDEILKFNAKTNEVESMVAEDRIITSGEAIVNIVYYGGNKVNSINHTIPFNHFVEMPGVTNLLTGKIEYEVAEGNYEVVGNELGERKLIDLELKIRVIGKAYEEKSREVIVDAYSTKENLLIEREEININEDIKEIKHTEDIRVELDNIDALEILDIDGYVSTFDRKIVEDAIYVDGILSLDIQYIDRMTEEISTYKTDFPFSSSIYEEAAENAQLSVESSILDLKSNIKRDGLEIDSKVLLDIGLSRNRKIYGIREIKEIAEPIDDKNKPSITIYFVQKGDTLWDIAKRYKTTTEEILMSNNSTSGEIHPGDKIIIEKKIEELAI